MKLPLQKRKNGGFDPRSRNGNMELGHENTLKVNNNFYMDTISVWERLLFGNIIRYSYHRSCFTVNPFLSVHCAWYIGDIL